MEAYPRTRQVEIGREEQRSLVVEVDHALGVNGLTIARAAGNVGVRPGDYGAGEHPSLSPGAGLVDRCTMRQDSGSRIVVDDERRLPVGTEAAVGTVCVFRAPRLGRAMTSDFAVIELDTSDTLSPARRPAATPWGAHLL